MNPLSKFGVWILVIAASVVLPLYELADYTEVWAHDGDIILPALFFLFAGMALLAGKLVVRNLLMVLAGLSRIRVAGILLRSATFSQNERSVNPSPPPKDWTLTFCDLRI